MLLILFAVVGFVLFNRLFNGVLVPKEGVVNGEFELLLKACVAAVRKFNLFVLPDRLLLLRALLRVLELELKAEALKLLLPPPPLTSAKPRICSRWAVFRNSGKCS